MAESTIDDLLALDRDVARAVGQVERWREGLAQDPDASAEQDPFEGVRRASAKSTRDALRAWTPGAADGPLRDSLMTWVAALVQTRIGLADELARAREVNTARGRFHGPTPRLVSWREAWRGIVAARTGGEAQCWLEAACEAGAGLAAIGRRSAARRVEVARRLGFSHPWEISVPISRDAIREAATRLLDATEDVTVAVRRQAGTGASGAAATLHQATARDAGEGWPAHLSSRWLEEMFGALTSGLRIRLPRLPPALGASSFARALYAFGFAARVGAAPSSLPHGLSREVASVGAHRHGFVFASLAADMEFQRRELGLGRRIAAGQARMLARSALLDVRLHAARILLGDDEVPSPASLFDEIGARLFGAPLDARLRGAWPFPRDDEPGRFVALLQAPSLRETLRNRFDSDWFRNPAAWAQLRAQGAMPVPEPIDEAVLVPSAQAQGRLFEEALG
ncbi:MAG: hypothetical protein ABSF69_16660 [Polyangiaceae bacterium]|jgi:hypothetical protein